MIQSRNAISAWVMALRGAVFAPLVAVVLLSAAGCGGGKPANQKALEKEADQQRKMFEMEKQGKAP